MWRVDEQRAEHGGERESGGRDGCCEQVDAKAEGEGRATDGDGQSEAKASGQGRTARQPGKQGGDRSGRRRLEERGGETDEEDIGRSGARKHGGAEQCRDAPAPPAEIVGERSAQDLARSGGGRKREQGCGLTLDDPGAGSPDERAQGDGGQEPDHQEVVGLEYRARRWGGADAGDGRRSGERGHEEGQKNQQESHQDRGCRHRGNGQCTTDAQAENAGGGEESDAGGAAGGRVQCNGTGADVEERRAETGERDGEGREARDRDERKDLAGETEEHGGTSPSAAVDEPADEGLAGEPKGIVEKEPRAELGRGTGRSEGPEHPAGGAIGGGVGQAK